MKAVILVALFALIGMGGANAEIDIPVSPEERAQLDDLNSRVSRKDFSALSDGLGMRPEIAVRYLEHSILHGESDESRIASALIAKVPNYRQYFTERLERTSGKADTDTERDNVFRVLSKIRTGDAVRVVGPSLSDDRVVWPSARDIAPAPNSILALNALVAMDIPGAPTKWQSSYTADDIKRWQEWWKTNEGRIDEILKEPRNSQRSELSPSGAPPFASSPPILPNSAPASEPKTRTAQNLALAAEQRTSVWPWLLGFLALVVIVVVALKRRA